MSNVKTVLQFMEDHNLEVRYAMHTYMGGSWPHVKSSVTVSDEYFSFNTTYCQGIACLDAKKCGVFTTPVTPEHMKNRQLLKGYQKPCRAEVLFSLVQDTIAIMEGQEFDDWADEYGYNPDSRKAYSTFCECSRIADELLNLGSKKMWHDFLEVCYAAGM